MVVTAVAEGAEGEKCGEGEESGEGGDGAMVRKSTRWSRRKSARRTQNAVMERQVVDAAAVRIQVRARTRKGV